MEGLASAAYREVEMICRVTTKPVTSRSVAGLLALALAMAGAGPVAATEGRKAAQDDAAPALSGPAVMAVVSLVDQRIALYDAEGGVIRAKVSSGRSGYETPVGIFSVLQKKKDHTSNLYEDAAMPFMQRMTWSGVALHGGALPGYPASAGCVRLPHRFAKEIFQLTKLGTRVIVARRDVAPVAFSHSKLPKPRPVSGTPVLQPTAYEPEEEAAAPRASVFEADVSNWPARQAELEALRSVAESKEAEAKVAAEPVEELKGVVKARAAEKSKTARAKRNAERAKGRAEARLQEAERRLSRAKSPATIKSREEAQAKAQAALDEAETMLAEATAEAEAAEQAHARANAELEAAEAVKTAADAAAKEARRKTLPVSVFVSLKQQRLYIRQGHEAVLDVPVEISEPEVPIGTHVYTAVSYTDGGDDMSWTVVSIGPHAAGQEGHAKKAEPTPTDPVRAGAALDRITIPPEISARLSDALWPGSALIVSDEEQSKETGEATDFVVLISGEPQGGLVIRPRQERQPSRPDYFVDYDGYYYYDEYGRRYDRRRVERRNDRRYGRYDRYDRYYNERRRPPRDRSFFGLW